MKNFRNVSFAGALALLLAGCGDAGERAAARGDAALRANDPVAAAKFFADSAEQGATNRAVLVKLAVTAAVAGDVAVAREASAKAIAADPASAEAKLAVAYAAYLGRDYDKAADSFRAVAETEALAPELRSQAYAGSAVTDIAAGRIDAARVALWRALRLDRRSAVAWYHLGYLSRNTYHATAAAIEQFEMAGRLQPDPMRARAIRAVTIPALRETLRAKSAAVKGADSRDPAAAAALVTEGERALSRQRVKAAAEKFAQAYRKDPFSYAAAWHHAKMLAQAKKSDPARTLAVFQAAADAKPTSQQVYRAAARYALQAGRVSDAVTFLDRALAHDFEDRETLDLYIQALGKAGRTRDVALYKAWRHAR